MAGFTHEGLVFEYVVREMAVFTHERCEDEMSAAARTAKAVDSAKAESMTKFNNLLM